MSNDDDFNTPVQDIYKRHMQAIAETLNEFLNADQSKPETGFMLLVFPLSTEPGDSYRANYMSNAHRADCIRMLRDQLEHFERQERHENPPEPGGGMQ
jgi:hypothetical protein